MGAFCNKNVLAISMFLAFLQQALSPCSSDVFLRKSLGVVKEASYRQEATVIKPRVSNQC